MEEPLLESFHCKVVACNSFLTKQGKDYSVKFIKKRRLPPRRQVFSVNFEKKLWTRLFCKTASEILSNKEFII